jgi:hypothetical protein
VSKHLIRNCLKRRQRQQLADRNDIGKHHLRSASATPVTVERAVGVPIASAGRESPVACR